MANSYYVYIMASGTGVLYIGVTNNVIRRAAEHKQDINEGFTKKYRCHKLVYVEESVDIQAALSREKQLKGWSRSKKMFLIKQINPDWDDLAEQ